MPKTTLSCRVCGKTYVACRSNKMGEAFRWQDIACSQECGAIYLRKLMESRGSEQDKTVSEKK